MSHWPISNLLIAGDIFFDGRYDAISTALAGVSTEMPFEDARNAASRDGLPPGGLSLWMISTVIEARAAVMPRKCAYATIP